MFQRRINTVGEGEIIRISTEDEFKNFRDTYRITTFHMIVGQLYPNPETDRQRAICIGAIIISVTPVTAMILLDVYNSWLRRDIVNIIRHMTIIGPLSFTLLKMILFFMRRSEAYQIIKTIDNDYSSYNTLPEPHKVIARRGVRDTKLYNEFWWAIVVSLNVVTFPLTAGILNVYNCLFKSDPKLYMVHDVEKPFSKPEDRFMSPFYELTFVYMVYCALIFVLSFVGFDSFYGITINHVCLKIKLLCLRLDDAMMETDSDAIFKKMVDVVKQHNAVFRMVDLVQDTFNIWLGIILLATMAQICNCMYQIIEGYGIDIRYLMFIIATMVHIYMPCRYAAKLKDAAAEVSNRVYCSGWERTSDLRARRMAMFMIARAQIPVNITAFNMVNFDMELFVSIMQTSYSLFTLLRP
uniref:Odorant receptor n=1 Tax=Epiphyas postvittana TaxID=65032 RepID=A0A0K8TUV9_EPIPO